MVVVSWNTRDELERCLRSLAPDVESGRASVHIVDNGSTDGSPDMVRERFPWAELQEPGENLGYGRAVNLVAGRIRSPWIAASNADVEVEPNAFARLLTAADRRTGAVAPRLILPDGSTQHSVHRFPTLPLLLTFNAGLHRLVPRLGDRLLFEGHWDPERPRRVPWAIGAFLLLRREAFEAVGGFDPAQWMYAEDVDLGWRLARAGWQTRYEPRARVRHTSGAAARQAFGERPYERWMAASYDWMERRYGRRHRIAAAAISLAGAALRRDRAWTRIHLRALRKRSEAKRPDRPM